MEAAEDINASKTKTALVEEWYAIVLEIVLRKEDDQDLDLDPDPDQGTILLPVSHPWYWFKWLSRNGGGEMFQNW